MKKLIDCVDMRYEDGTFLLIPRQANEMDLVMLGFDGTEKWYRLKCSQTHSSGLANGTWEYNATICNKDGKSFTWHWGFSGYDLVSDSVNQKEKKIVEACRMYCDRVGIDFPGYRR